MKLALALAVCLLIPLAGAQETPWLELGSDASGDDSESLSTPAGGFGAGTAGTALDDILSGAIRTVDSNIEFIFYLTSSPDDEPTAWNSYCWNGAFELRKSGEEFVGMVCYDFAPGGGWGTLNTNRGTEVANEQGVWDETQNTLTVTVPLANIGAEYGDVLDDIYMMTYSGGLFVSDTMPDAKSDRNAASSLGSYIIGAEQLGGPVAPEGEKLPAQFADTDAVNILLDYSYEVASDQVWNYNWTNDYPTGNVTLGADMVSGSVNFVMLDDANGTMLDVTLEAPFEQNVTFEGFEGLWKLQVTFTYFQGNASVSIVPDAPVMAPNPLAGPGAVPVDNGGTFEDGNAEEKSKDSPGVPLLLALLGFAFVAMRRRA